MSLAVVLLPIIIASQQFLAAQTIYAVVLGNQDYVVGSSTLRSGLFVSNDIGRTWHHLGPENLKGYAVDIVPESAGRTLYLAAGNGVHKSSDYGATWKIVTDWRMTEVMDVAVDPVDTNVVYAATAFGFWYSPDGGNSWVQSCSRLDSVYLNSLEVVTVASDSSAIDVCGDNLHFSFTWSPATASLCAIDQQLRLRASRWSAANHPFHRQVESTHRTALSAFDTMLSGMLSHSTAGWIVTPEDTLFWADLWLDKELGHAEVHKTPALGRYSTGTIVLEDADQPIHALGWINATSTLLAGTYGDGIFAYDGATWKRMGLEGSQIWSIHVQPYTLATVPGHVHDE